MKKEILPWNVFVYLRWNLKMAPMRQHVGSFLFEQHARKFARLFPKASRAELKYAYAPEKKYSIKRKK